MSTSQLNIREIQKTDISEVAKIIRDTLTEYECVGEEYSISDPEIDDMHSAYSDPRSKFYVITDGNSILGCGGFAQLEGSSEDTCELRKMYFKHELRGRGYGQILLDICLFNAKELGYSKCYLETVERMERANRLYLRNGFERLSCQEGDTGHSGCDAYYVKSLI